MRRRVQLERDIQYAEALLELNGYHPFLRELLINAKQELEKELSELETPMDSAA
jgi:hypothetical protein